MTSICNRKPPKGRKISFGSWFPRISAQCGREGAAEPLHRWQWECGEEAVHAMMDQEARRKDLKVTFKSSPSVACFCLLHPILLNLHSLRQAVIGWGRSTRNMRLFQAQSMSSLLPYCCDKTSRLRQFTEGRVYVGLWFQTVRVLHHQGEEGGQQAWQLTQHGAQLSNHKQETKSKLGMVAFKTSKSHLQ